MISALRYRRTVLTGKSVGDGAMMRRPRSHYLGCVVRIGVGIGESPSNDRRDVADSPDELVVPPARGDRWSAVTPRHSDSAVEL